MNIIEQVKQMNEELEQLRKSLVDVHLIRDTLTQLTTIVDDIINKAPAPSDTVPETQIEVVKDEHVNAAVVAIPDSRYQVTEVGGDDQPASTYKVDSNKYLPGDF